jgi:hypothetical protein
VTLRELELALGDRRAAIRLLLLRSKVADDTRDRLLLFRGIDMDQLELDVQLDELEAA